MYNQVEEMKKKYINNSIELCNCTISFKIKLNQSIYKLVIIKKKKKKKKKIYICIYIYIYRLETTINDLPYIALTNIL